MTDVGSTGEDVDQPPDRHTAGTGGPSDPSDPSDPSGPGRAGGQDRPGRQGRPDRPDGPDGWRGSRAGPDEPDGSHGPDGWHDDWPLEPRGRRGWLLAAFGVVVVAVAAGVVKLATGGPDVAPVDPAKLAAPVTLPPSSPAPAPRPTSTPKPSGSPGAAPAAEQVCPGSDGVSADDQPGWQHETVPVQPDSPVACAGRYSLHTTSTAGGIFYRWAFDVDQAGHCDIAVYVPDTPRADVALVHYTVLDGGAVVEGFVIAQAGDHGQLVPAGSYPAGGGTLTVQMDNRSPVPGTVVASAVQFTCHPG